MFGSRTRKAIHVTLSYVGQPNAPPPPSVSSHGSEKRDLVHSIFSPKPPISLDTASVSLFVVGGPWCRRAQRADRALVVLLLGRPDLRLQRGSADRWSSSC